MQSADDFFRVFCDLVNADDYSGITRLFSYPVTIAYVNPTKVYNSPPEVAEVMRAQCVEYRKIGTERITVEVTSDVANESGTHFVDVVWSFFDQRQAPMFTYPACYILREDKIGNLKTIMFASHNVEECSAYLKACPTGAPTGVAID